MKYLTITLIITALVLLLFSCEKEVEFDEKLIEPKLVVNAFIEQGKTIDVTVAASKKIAGVSTMFTYFDDATVKLFEDGIEKETLILFDTVAVGTNNITNGVQVPRIYKSTTIAEAGKTYKLVVTRPNYETIQCETKIPVPVQIFSIDTLTIVEVNEYNTNTYLETKIKFKDTPNEENYYRLIYTTIYGKPGSNYENPNDTSTFVYIYEETRGTHINSSDKLINPKEEDANDFLFGSPSNMYNIFTDELIDGKEYELKFFINNLNNSTPGIPVNSELGKFQIIKVELQTLSREAYLYMKSVHAHNYYQGDFFSEPVQVFTNIENGLGVFSGFSSSSIELSDGAYPIEGITYKKMDNYYYY